MAEVDGGRSDELEERIINEEYKIWKKNTPYLYDLVITHALEWPSLTCQWLPERKEPEGKEYSVQKMILGTHTSDGEQNSLLVVEVYLPLEDTEVDCRQYDDERGEIGSFGGTEAKIHVIQHINHKGEVNRARYMPQNPFLIATKSPTSEVYVFDYSKHPSTPKEKSGFCPDLRLKGHTAEGYGINWSPVKEGHVVSGADDGVVCYWDINRASTTNRSIEPVEKFILKGVVEDVAWHTRHDYMFGSVGDDQMIQLWDTRKPEKPSHAVQSHNDAVNCISFNPENPYLFVTGSSDKDIRLWDIRKMEDSLHILRNHWDEVYQCQWNPLNETVLASCGADRRVMIWDLAQIGAEQTKEEMEDGPPEVLFVHGGHTSKVSELSWNLNDDWVLSSVAEDNILQVWQMAENLYLPNAGQAPQGAEKAAFIDPGEEIEEEDEIVKNEGDELGEEGKPKAGDRKRKAEEIETKGEEREEEGVEGEGKEGEVVDEESGEKGKSMEE